MRGCPAQTLEENTMKSHNLLIPALVLALGELPAVATTVPAMTGHGWPNASDPCFTTSFAQVSNTCTDGTQHLLVIPVNVPATNVAYTATVRLAGGSSQTGSSCQAMGIAGDNSAFSFSALKTSTSWQTVQTLNLGLVGVGAGGTLHFECHVGGADWYGIAGRIVNVEFN
jgi:hypothetical protein